MVLFVGSSAVTVKVCRLPDSSNVESQDPWKILYTVWTKAQVPWLSHQTNQLASYLDIHPSVTLQRTRCPVRPAKDHYGPREPRGAADLSTWTATEVQFSARTTLSQLPLWFQCLEVSDLWQKLGLQCHFSWFMRPYLGVASSIFQEIVPINVPKTLRLTCLFWFRDDRLHNCDDPNGSLKNFELQQKINPYRESDRVTTSRLCFWYRSLPCFSMFFLTPQVRWTFPKLDLPKVPGFSIREPQWFHVQNLVVFCPKYVALYFQSLSSLRNCESRCTTRSGFGPFGVSIFVCWPWMRTVALGMVKMWFWPVGCVIFIDLTKYGCTRRPVDVCLLSSNIQNLEFNP